MYYKLTCIFLFFVFIAKAQDKFASQSLETLWEKLPVNCQKGLQINKEYACSLKGSAFLLKSELDGNKMVHLGLKLFNDSIKEIDNHFVYSFIECELLKFILDDEQSRNLRQREDKVFLYYSSNLQKKSLLNNTNSMRNVVSDLTGVSINQDSLNYRVLLLNSDYERLEIEFPKVNTLIRGMDKKELDDFIYGELLKNIKDCQTHRNGLVDGPFKSVGNILVSEGEHYLIKGFSANTYYKREKDSLKVLFQKDSINESFSNLFLTDLPLILPTQLELKIRSYSGNDQPVSTTVGQFLAHFGPEYKLFFGVENNQPDGIRGSLIIYCPALNYIHLLDVKTTASSLFGDQPKVTGIFYPYIPCHNIKEMFGKNDVDGSVLDNLIK